MPRVRLSVIIPYSGDPSLSRTLASLSRQSGVARQCEVIIVVDGPLEVDSLLSGIVCPFPVRVERYVREQGFRGHSAGPMRNLGARHARGSILVFIDSDCITHEDCLRRHLKAQSLGPLTAVCGKMRELPVESHYLLDQPFDTLAEGALDDSRAELEASDGRIEDCQWVDFYSCNASVPAGLFRAAGGFDESGLRCHDMELAYRLHKLGATFVYSPQAEVIHVEHPRSLTSRLEQAAGWELIRARHPELESFADDQILVTHRAYERIRAICEKDFDELTASLPGTRVEQAFVLSPRMDRKQLEARISHTPYVVMRGVDCNCYHLRLERNCWDYYLVHSDSRVDDEPSVSVVITTFNSSGSISRALKSVLAQTVQSFEVLVVDDASTDETVNVVDRFSSDGRIRLIEKSVNGGLGRALNTALEHVRAPVFVQLDADDWLEPNALDVLQRGFEDDLRVAAVYCNPIMEGPGSPPMVMKGHSVNSPLELLSYKPVQAPRAYRVKALREARGWDVSDFYEGRYFEDRLMLSRLAECFEVRFVDEQVYHVWEHPQSLSRSAPTAAAIARFDILCQRANYFGVLLDGPILKGGLGRSFRSRRGRENRRSWSVIIPARNRLELLKYCLASWFQSDYSDSEAEIIVVDDASDVPLEEALGPTGWPVRFVRSSRRRGPSWCRNRGAAMAGNEILFFSDSDQIVPPDVLRNHERRHSQRADALVTGSLLSRRCFTYLGSPSAVPQRMLGRLLDLLAFTDNFDEVTARIALDAPVSLVSYEENIWERAQEFSFTDSHVGRWIYLILACGGDLNDYEHKWMSVGTGNLSISKQLFEGLGGFSPSLKSMEDWEFGARAQARGVEFICAPETPSFHQVHPDESRWAAVDGHSARSLKRLHPELVAALDDAPDFFEPPGAEVFWNFEAHHAPEADRDTPNMSLPQIDGVCALTFDDGPHPVGTEMLLEALDAARIKATFFMLGKEISRNKVLCRRLLELGHEIGAHGWTHTSPKAMTTDEIFDGLRMTVREIGNATGFVCKFTRPCFGLFTPSFQQAASRLDLTPIGWHLSSKDWTASSQYDLKKALAVGGVNGKIILFHDGAGDPQLNVLSVKWLAGCLAQANIRPVKVSEYIAMIDDM